MFIWHGSLLSLLLIGGGCLDPIVLGGIVCDDEVDLHSVLKSDANSSSPLRNCHQRANLFPCVLTEDEQLHLQKQFGRVSKLSAQPEVSFTVCVHVQKLCILKVSAFPFPSVSMWSGSCERMVMYRTTSHYHNSFFFGSFKVERIFSIWNQICLQGKWLGDRSWSLSALYYLWSCTSLQKGLQSATIFIWWHSAGPSVWLCMVPVWFSF